MVFALAMLTLHDKYLLHYRHAVRDDDKYGPFDEARQAFLVVITSGAPEFRGQKTPFSGIMGEG